MSAPALSSRSLKASAIEILRLALPVAVVQLGLLVPLLIDVAVAGRTSALASIGLGAEIFTGLVMFGMGTMLALEPLVAHSLGAGDQRSWPILRAGLRVARTLAVLGIALSLALAFALERSALPDDIGHGAAAYLVARSPGLWAIIVATACRTYLQSLKRVKWVVVAVMLTAALSLALDLAVLASLADVAHEPRGRVPLAVGIGAARTVVEGVLAGVLYAMARRARQGSDVAPERREIRSVWRLGVPVGLHMSMVVGLLTLLAALMARMGEGAAGGHQIAATVLAGLYQIELAVAVATSIHIAFAMGAGRTSDARRFGFAGLIVGWIIVGSFALLIAVFRFEVARAFTDNIVQIASAGAFLGIVGVLLVSDVTQVIASGALRGLGDTRTPFLVHASSHWLVGAPVALLLAKALGPTGLWWGLGVGLTAAAIVLSVRFLRLTRPAAAGSVSSHPRMSSPS
jgi:MATE family multidrug resistance protein